MSGDWHAASGSALASLLKLEEGVDGSMLLGRENFERYLYERYHDNQKLNLLRLRAFYFLKPLIPRSVQLFLRKRYLAIQSHRDFPRWPIEPTLVDLVGNALAEAGRAAGDAGIHRLDYWPDGNRFALALTHDVEWDAGLRNAPRVAEVEQRYGFHSSWNIVPERYPIDWEIVDALRRGGSEIGVHGLRHDGRLFIHHHGFRKQLRRIHRYAKRWGAVGFRSPSTLRRADWMGELDFEYDSSFPDTDPYEPQPGGCLSIWPFFFGNVVELPLTMPQDHTLFQVLNQTDISTWKLKADWIIEHGGLILLNVHPDYMEGNGGLKRYEELLVYLKGKQSMYHALPRDIARWWRDRSGSTVRRRGSRVVIEGPAAGRGRILNTRWNGSAVVNSVVGR